MSEAGRQLKARLQPNPLGYGTFKIGRNEKIKYPSPYDLPSEALADQLLDQLRLIGIRYFDTAPAYGLAEQRMGPFVARHRSEIILSSKVGELFSDGQSYYDFSVSAARDSLARSLQRLQTDYLDLLLIHSDGRDLEIQNGGLIDFLREAKASGQTRAIGFSGKTPEGARAALDWADAIMVEYHLQDTSHAEVMHDATASDVAVIVKKALASGHLTPDEAIRFVLDHDAVDALVIGSLSLENMQQNLATVAKVR